MLHGLIYVEGVTAREVLARLGVAGSATEPDEEVLATPPARIALAQLERAIVVVLPERELVAFADEGCWPALSSGGRAVGVLVATVIDTFGWCVAEGGELRRRVVFEAGKRTRVLGVPCTGEPARGDEDALDGFVHTLTGIRRDEVAGAGLHWLPDGTSLEEVARAVAEVARAALTAELPDLNGLLSHGERALARTAARRIWAAVNHQLDVAAVLPALRVALREPDAELRVLGVRALHAYACAKRTMDADTVLSLCGVLADEDGDVRTTAIKALIHANDATDLAPAAAALIGTLADPDAYVRYVGTFALRRVVRGGKALPSAVLPLAALLADPDADTIELALETLERLTELRCSTSPAQVLGALVTALAHARPAVRARAARVLAATEAAASSPAAAVALRGAAADPDEMVRQNALFAARKLALDVHPA